MDEIVGGRYKLIERLARGSMSDVYLAEDIRLNKTWAVKKLYTTTYDKTYNIRHAALLSEANILKRLDHPNLPRIVDIFEEDSNLYITIDFIEGETLEKIMVERGAQDESDVIDWAIQLCNALEYLHTRTPAILYLDMKPSNIILTPTGSLKLVDFGISREYYESNITISVMGTRGYAPPEQYGGKVDTRTDIYSLGVTLFYLLTGCDPTKKVDGSFSIRHWNPSLSENFEIVINKCTQLNPSDRYQSCKELLYDLQHYETLGRRVWIKNYISYIYYLAKRNRQDKNRKYINGDYSNDTAKTDIISAQYMAEILANAQKNEVKHTPVGGPDFNE